MSPVIIAVIGSAVLVVLVVLLILRRIKVAGPNQAFLVTGAKGRSITNAAGQVSTDMSGQKVVMGASVFVLPVVQKLHTIDLSSRRIPVGIRGAVSKQGVKCDLEGVAIVKVGGTEDSIRAAAQRFLNQQSGIDIFTSEVLAGALRSIVGRLTHRGDHPGPRGFRLRRRRGGRVLPHRPGSGAGHLPAAGHPGRGLLPRRPRPSRGRARGQGGRASQRPAPSRPPSRSSLLAAGGDRHLAAAAGAEAGRDQRRDRRGEGRCGRGRPARQGRAGPAGAARAGEGRAARRRR